MRGPRPAVQGNARALGLCSVMFVSSAGMVSDVRFGSLADIRARIWDVSFTPKSGHAERRYKCPPSANSGHHFRSVAADVAGRRQFDGPRVLLPTSANSLRPALRSPFSPFEAARHPDSFTGRGKSTGPSQHPRTSSRKLAVRESSVRSWRTWGCPKGPIKTRRIAFAYQNPKPMPTRGPHQPRRR